MPLTVLPGRSREADQLQRALEGRLPRRQLTPAVGGYVEVAARLADVVPTTSLRPSAEFRAELHERLLELAVARSATLSAEPGAADSAQPGAETAERRRRLAGLIGFAWLAWFTRGWRRTATAATGALLALSVGVGLAAASAVPGGLLYPVKELIQSAQVQLAQGDLARGKVLLDQAGGHIDDARTLVSRGAPEPADVDTALRAASGDLGDAQHDLLAHFARTQDPAALTALARFATEQSPELAQLRGRVPVESEPLVDSLLAQLGSTAAQLRTLTAQCGAPCASVPVGGLPGADGLLASASSAATGGPGVAGSAGSGLGGLLGTGGNGTGSGTTGGLGGVSGPVSVGSGGVGVQVPGLSATVPAPGASIGSSGESVTVPPVGATLGPVSVSLPGVGVAVPPLLSHSSTNSTASSASSSSSVCVLIICVG